MARGDRAGDEVGACFDPIRQHPMAATVQTLDAVDDDDVGARAAHFGAERVQTVRKIDHLRLTRGVLDDRLTVGERGGHHQVFGTGDRHRIEHQTRAAQARGAGADVAVLDRDLGTHRLQASDMDVDGTGADGTAARQRHIGLAEPRQQRSEHEDRGAHGLDEVVRRDRLAHGARVDLDVHALIDGHRSAHATEQLDHGGDVLQVRHIADRHGLGGEQRRGEDG